MSTAKRGHLVPSPEATDEKRGSVAGLCGGMAAERLESCLRAATADAEPWSLSGLMDGYNGEAPAFIDPGMSAGGELW